MYCPKCGEDNPDNALFCKNCGSKLDVKKSVTIESNQSSANTVERPKVNYNESNNAGSNNNVSNNGGSNDILGYIGCCCLCIVILYVISMIIY